MPVRGEVYQCRGKKMMVEVIGSAEGELEFHGRPMVKLAENTRDAAREKHVPGIEKMEGGWRGSVGSVEHPMEASQFIEWIELSAGDLVCRRYLEPGQKPVVEFPVKASQVTAREHCNLHGLWKN